MANRLGCDAVAKHLAKGPMKASVDEIVGAISANLSWLPDRNTLL